MTQIDHRKPPSPRFKGDHAELVPRIMVRAMFALVMSTLAIATYARVTDRPLVATPPEGEVVISRQIVLDGDMAGRATVTSPEGEMIADLTPEEGGFISGVYRVIHRERLKHGVDQTLPLVLLQRDTGRLEIHDPETGWRADLMGFGADNARAFARLLAHN
jgi:putative photosynthetic complex assembly protein